MKMISWNVNGLRAVLKHDFETSFKALDADWFCLQETKMQAGQTTLDLPGYHQYFNYAERKGYSGTAILTKHEPLNVTYGIGVPEFDTEGRVITLEYPKFYLITVYTPNSGSELKRLEFRQGWDKAFLAYTKALAAKKAIGLLWGFKRRPQADRFKKILPPITTTPASPMKNATTSPPNWTMGLSTRFAIFTPIKLISTLGGVTVSGLAPAMLGGGSIISSAALTLCRSCKMLRSTTRSSGQTTVQLNWLWTVYYRSQNGFYCHGL